MPIRLNEASDEHFLVVHIWGKLAKADYERFFHQFAEIPQRPGRLRILFDMIGFEGWDAGALWDEIGFDLKHANDFERVATVGDSKWQHALATLIKPFTKAETRYFDATQYAAAREWLSESTSRQPRQGRSTMKTLAENARLMLADHKGLLAMDESNGTCNKRFAKAGIAQTGEARRRYRELILTTPGLSEYVSGVILYDETIRQSQADGTPFLKLIDAAGILPGIKVDTGARDLAGHAGEKITEGLDGLRERLHDYFALGARFAKWRAVIGLGATGLGDGLPTHACIDANAHALARYAALCQESGLVPIIEPEVLMDGDHSLSRCQQTTERALRAVFDQLAVQNVALDGVILKPNMILPGLASPVQPTANEVADATVETLRRAVPVETAGIAFLSGGQSGELASARLNAMNAKFKAPSAAAPWPLGFSFARAIQQPALEIWAGKDSNREAAQRALLHRARCNSAARRGAYAPSMEVSGS